jgi:hypothetical protein
MFEDQGSSGVESRRSRRRRRRRRRRSRPKVTAQMLVPGPSKDSIGVADSAIVDGVCSLGYP